MTRPEAGTPAALRLEAVAYRYPRNASPSLQGIDLSFRRGETVAFMGPNGSGKTTLLRIAAGLLAPRSGRVLVRLNGHEEPLLAPRAEIGYIPQHLGLLRAKTVLDNVLVGSLGRLDGWRTLLGRYPPQEEERARAWIETVGLTPKAHAKVHRLSGGERQRVAIARALMQHPKLLVADEFASNLDPVRQRETLALVRDRLDDAHVTTLMALHNLELAKRLSDRIVFLREGHVVADLPSPEVTEEVAQRHLTG